MFHHLLLYRTMCWCPCNHNQTKELLDLGSPVDHSTHTRCHSLDRQLLQNPLYKGMRLRQGLQHRHRTTHPDQMSLYKQHQELLLHQEVHSSCKFLPEVLLHKGLLLP